MDSTSVDEKSFSDQKMRPILTILVPFFIGFLVLVLIEIVYTEEDDQFEVKNDLRALAFALTHICDHLDIRSFAHSGTLLGCIRSGDIIEHDDDVDLGILETHLPILQEFCSQNNSPWSLEKSPFIRDGSLYVFSHCSTSTTIDVFLFVEEEEEIPSCHSRYSGTIFRYIGECYAKWEKEVFYEEPWVEMYPLGKFDATGSVFVDLLRIVPKEDPTMIIDGGFVHAFVRGPANPVPYLTSVYGDDWRKPKMTHVHGVNGFRTSVFYFLVVLLILFICSGFAVFSHYM